MLDLITQMGKSIKDSAIIIIDITAKPSSTLSIIIVPKAEENFMLFFARLSKGGLVRPGVQEFRQQQENQQR